MRLVRKVLAYARVLPKGTRNRTDLLRFLFRRPALLAAVGTYDAEAAQQAWERTVEFFRKHLG